MRLPRILLLVAAAAATAPAARADWADIAPRPFDSGAYLDVFASLEQDDNPSSIGSVAWSDTFLREKVTVFSNGYFYHPRFLQYQASLSGALKQEQYRATFIDSPGWTHSTGVEYDTRLFLLPEHPYSLDLFALRYEPLYREAAATQRNSLQTSWGGLFKYRRSPAFFNARYNDSTNESAGSSSNVQRFGADAEYFKRFDDGNQLSLNGSYNPSRFSNSRGLDGNATEYLFGSYLDLKQVRLNSSVALNSAEQSVSRGGTLENDQFAWYELLNVYFPYNFRADLSYRYQDNDSTVPLVGPVPDRTLSDLSKIWQLDIVHRLFQSLDTTYTYLNSSRTSSGGDTDFHSNNLSVNYTKTVPLGRVLAGVGVGRGETENVGRADVVDEPHPATPVPGTFRLGQPNADPGTILVFLRSPLPPFDIIRLVENLHYTVLPTADTFDITVLTLPPQFVVPGTYDFLASYSLVVGEFTLRSDNLSYNVSVELLDTMLTPYYSHSQIRSDVLSGTFPGTPLDSTTRTVGMRYHSGPIRALGEFQDFQWEISPYEAWRLEFQYVGPLNPTTRLYATASYLDKHYPQGTSPGFDEPFTDRTGTVSGSFQKELLDRSLLLSAGGSFTRLSGRVTGNGYSLNSSLTWHVGKMDVTAGASAYRSETEGTAGVLTDRFHEYYFINIRRWF